MIWQRILSANYRPGTPAFYALGVLGAAAFYLLALLLVTDHGPGLLLANLAANLVPLVVVSIAARAILLRYILPLPAIPQAVTHLCAAFAYSALWFFLLMVFLGLVEGEAPMRFSVTPFLGGAAVWQMLQGATFYAMIALVTYAETIQSLGPSDPSEPVGQDTSPTKSRIFIRDGDEMRPLDTARVVCINAAGDYAEVVTRSGTHLLRRSLGDLEESLGPEFLRVHRSTIVNIDCVDRVEPAGSGRLSVHLINGITVVASRSGAKAIREKTL